MLCPYTEKYGKIHNLKTISEMLNSYDTKLIVAADLISLCVLKKPSLFNCDVVVGASQRFGIPLGYGGPHAGYFATKKEYKRSIPGRIIGVSKDRNGNRALRMALQTREQHIKRGESYIKYLYSTSFIGCDGRYVCSLSWSGGIKTNSRKNKQLNKGFVY